MTRKQWFFKGLKNGIPIALGYFAVSIALGISAKKAGIPSLGAAITSLLINASAGEYVGFALIAANATYLEVFLMEAVANARYLLMSASLSQKLKPGVKLWKRLLLGFTVTDEIFGVSMLQPEPIDPVYTYGVFLVATCGWTGGTFFRGNPRRYPARTASECAWRGTVRNVHFGLCARGTEKPDRCRPCRHRLCRKLRL